MTDESDSSGALAADALRLTPFGASLRAMSLDELPELWNIVRGDMSVVGPRPLPTAYLPRYTREERRRHDVRPGLTGWAQINGRNAVEWDARLAMDVWYVDHRSMRLDAQIIARTVSAVLSRSGINADGEATMGELRPRTQSQPQRPKTSARGSCDVTDLVIIGAGGHGREILDIVEACRAAARISSSLVSSTTVSWTKHVLARRGHRALGPHDSDC